MYITSRKSNIESFFKFEILNGSIRIYINLNLFMMTFDPLYNAAPHMDVQLELLMCDGGVCSILLLPLVARCLETIDVCIWPMFVFMSVVVTVWGSVGMFIV